MMTNSHQYSFETKLKYIAARKGVLCAGKVKEHILVATPPEFQGGIEGIWSPEQLFLGSLSSCLMTTFLAFAARKELPVTDFECNAIGRVGLVEGHLEFISIDLYPKITVGNETDHAVASEVLLKAGKHCIIANSVKTALVHHAEVVVAAAVVPV
jgi:organic hydroperoxide reductase OsmC/OhrA